MLSRRLNRFLPAAIPLIAVLLLAAGCGGSDDESPTTTPVATEGAVTAPDDGPATFEIAQLEDVSNGIAASGSQRFAPTSFIVSQGQQVTFNITNEGQGWHNMRVAGSDGVFGNADDVLSDHEPLFMPGDVGTLVFTAPDASGELQFRCDFHPDVMTGTIIVQ